MTANGATIKRESDVITSIDELGYTNKGAHDHRLRDLRLFVAVHKKEDLEAALTTNPVKHTYFQNNQFEGHLERVLERVHQSAIKSTNCQQ